MASPGVRLAGAKRSSLSTTVNCPTCDAYYKLKAERFGSRGAKLTCPKCGTLFLVFQPSDMPTVDDTTLENLDRFDFRTLGVDWQLRDPAGELRPLKNLATLRWYIDHERVEPSSRLAFNGATGLPLSEITDLLAYFWDVFERARNGHLGFSAPMLAEDSLPGNVPEDVVLEELSGDDAIEPVQVDSSAPEPVDMPRYGVLSPDSVPPVVESASPPDGLTDTQRVYITGGQSTGVRSSAAVVPILAVLFVFALALAVTLPFALQGIRGEEPPAPTKPEQSAGVPAAPSGTGVVQSRVTAESVPPPAPPVQEEAASPLGAEGSLDGSLPPVEEQGAPSAEAAPGAGSEAIDASLP